MRTTYRTPCGTCGACCRSYLVPLCGYDVWLINRRESLDPLEFALAMTQETPRSDGFFLAADGPAHGLLLDKRGKLKVDSACVFLVSLEGGHERCGIYEHRPAVCRAYPMEIAPGGVVVEKRALCPPGGWSDAELTKQTWRRAVVRTTMHFDLYSEVVARWNARVQARAGQQFSLTEFYSFLINLYERVAAMDALIDEKTTARLELTWGYVPDPERSKLRLSDLIWPDYLATFRGILDGFYPEIPPQPWPEVLGSAAASHPPSGASPGRINQAVTID